MNIALPAESARGHGRPDPRLEQVIKLAVLAVGGQGGGVLTSWIVDLAERNGFAVQATSVAGVAQRTGATIYYVEMLANAERQPVFSLAPTPGDVDILIAAELMEAGRAIMRGFVTPDRTALIASAHRAYATAEKIVPGDALADRDAVREAMDASARTVVAFDMQQYAVRYGTVISASLFGALAASGTLPFPQKAFEEIIETSGRGAQASMRAFRAAAFTTVHGDGDKAAKPPQPGTASRREFPKVLAERIARLPDSIQDMARRGLEKVVGFQDADYGAEYLDHLDAVAGQDRAVGGEDRGFELTLAAAKHIANAMAYDDVIRVADIKTAFRRLREVEGAGGAGEQSVLKVTEYFHPSAKELCSMLPVGLGRAIEARPGLYARIDRFMNRGRRVRSNGLGGFLLLYAVAGMRRFRRRLLRHEVESVHLEAWLEAALGHARTNYPLAVQMLNCRRLIKGYSDTHARGLSKFDKVMAAAGSIADREDAADWVERLITSALADEQGEALDGALKTIGSFADTA
ncbi:MAG: indolepyruvate oxidoreductase subunit beta family protein [Pseudomonadota bacterium]